MPTAAERRDRYRRIAYSKRNLPGKHGLRPYRVFITTGTYSGTFTGEGNETRTEVEILENGYPPKVRFLDDEALALGQLEKGAARIGPITPEHSTGGTDIDDILGTDLSNGETLKVRLSGPDGDAFYVISSKSFDRALHWMIDVSPVGNSD